MFYKLLRWFVLFALLGSGGCGGWPDEKTAEPNGEEEVLIEETNPEDLQSEPEPEPEDTTDIKDATAADSAEACENESMISGTQCSDGTIYVGQIENQNLFTTPPIHCTDFTQQECVGGEDAVQYTFSEAIRFCEDLNFAGHDDWYVPDIFELTLMVCKAKTAVGWRYQYPQFAPNCELFGGKANELEGFINDYYWSKTETFAGVYITSFGEGHQKRSFIFGWSPVRCVRKMVEAGGVEPPSANGPH